jgi:striatin 1/3/4
MPEVGKDFPPMVNGMNMLSGSSTSSAPQTNVIDRASLASNLLHHHQQQTAAANTGGPQTQPQQTSQNQHLSQLNTQMSDKDSDSEPQRLTAIYRDEAGEWKEKLRLFHEAAERERLRDVDLGLPANAPSWDRRSSDEEDPGNLKEVEDEEDDEESASDIVGEGLDGDGAKLWKAKRTLRK